MVQAGLAMGLSSSPDKVKHCLPLHVVSTGSGDHPVACLMGAVGTFPEAKAAMASSWITPI